MTTTEGESERSLLSTCAKRPFPTPNQTKRTQLKRSEASMEIASDKDDLTAQADRLSEQFSKTLTSLVDDVSFLRQLASLATSIEEGDSDAVERLCQMDDAVSDLEKKAKILKDIVADEERALERMEALVGEAKQRSRRLDIMLEAANAGKENMDRGSGFSDTRASLKDASDHNQSRHIENRRQPKQSPTQSNESSANQQLQQEQTKEKKSKLICLPRVSRAELNSVPREFRSHLSLAVVNEALTEIECFAREKATLIERNRRKRHLLKWNTEEEEDDSREFTITEQELRQSCAFFHSGESTARSVLLVLRVLHCIKQIPSKTGDVVYVIPS